MSDCSTEILPESFVKIVRDSYYHDLPEKIRSNSNKGNFYGYVMMKITNTGEKTKYLVDSLSNNGKPMNQSMFYCENLQQIESKEQLTEMAKQYGIKVDDNDNENDIFRKILTHKNQPLQLPGGGYRRKSLKRTNRKLSKHRGTRNNKWMKNSIFRSYRN